MDDSSMSRIAEAMEELRTMLYLVAKPQIQERLFDVLRSKEERQAYALTDGSTSARKIADEVGVHFTTISSWWRRWHIEGLVRKTGGRYQAVLDVDTFVLNAPLEQDDEG